MNIAGSDAEAGACVTVGRRYLQAPIVHIDGGCQGAELQAATHS